MRELCPDCKTELCHFMLENDDTNIEDVYGCPNCNIEIAYGDSIKQ